MVPASSGRSAAATPARRLLDSGGPTRLPRRTPITGQRPLAGQDRARRAVLPTDGAANAVDRCGPLDWPGTLDPVTDRGPAALIRRGRAAEAADHTGQQEPRYMPHDDATAAVGTFME
jgi:hypothetical protein